MKPFSIKDGSFSFLPQIFVYVFAAVFIPIGSIYKIDELIFALIALYLFYDIAFLRTAERFKGRDIDSILEDLRAACGYMAYYLPIAALLIAISNVENVQKILEKDNHIFHYLLIGVVAAAVSTLFIPVQYAVDTSKQPSSALRLCFVFVLFLQKVSVTVVVCALIRAGHVVWQLSQQSAS